MTTDFIDGDGGGEGESLEGGLLVIYFAELLVDQIVAENAQIDDFGSDCDFLDQFSQDVWIIKDEIPFAILADTWYFSMTPGVERVYSYSLSIWSF